ncbi:hypothetical protein [Deinococcus fonticola]|uniref:hypothetical protein n=1 Tax=Deinococcus fonticola TaxID=2528713 RepID=UPI001F0F8FBC|nr:hypothetical protein [Deinococcus fonticola]
MKRGGRRRAALLGLALLASAQLGWGQAAGIKVRPQGDALVKAVQTAIAQLATKDVPMTLDASSGPTITVGGVGVSAAPFNPDEIARVVLVGAERRIEINPQGPLPLAEAVKQVLMAELKLKEWTPAAAQQRFGGADLNGDGVTDLSDLAILMANFGTTTGAAGDLNQDRKVDDADLRLFSALYSKAIAQPQPAPAPAAPPATSPASGGSTPAPATATPATTTPATTTPAAGTPATPGTEGTSTDGTKPPAAPTSPAAPVAPLPTPPAPPPSNP